MGCRTAGNSRLRRDIFRRSAGGADTRSSNRRRADHVWPWPHLVYRIRLCSPVRRMCIAQLLRETQLPIHSLIEHEFKPLAALDAMQSVIWRSLLGGMTLSRAFWTEHNQCITNITLANSRGVRQGLPLVDRSQPLAILTASSQYSPQFEGNRTTRLPVYLAEAEARLPTYPTPEERLGRFVAFLAVNEVDFSMPDTGYMLTIGSYPVVHNGILRCYPRSTYEYQAGRLAPQLRDMSE